MRVIVNRVPKNPVIIRRFGTFRYVEIHSRERMTVNHDVTGSSPVGGAKKEYSLSTVGVDDAGGPPVPIPNTEVKLACAEDTWREAARENR